VRVSDRFEVSQSNVLLVVQCSNMKMEELVAGFQ